MLLRKVPLGTLDGVFNQPLLDLIAFFVCVKTGRLSDHDLLTGIDGGRLVVHVDNLSAKSSGVKDWNSI